MKCTKRLWRMRRDFIRYSRFLELITKGVKSRHCDKKMADK